MARVRQHKEVLCPRSKMLHYEPGAFRIDGLVACALDHEGRSRDRPKFAADDADKTQEVRHARNRRAVVAPQIGRKPWRGRPFRDEPNNVPEDRCEKRSAPFEADGRAHGHDASHGLRCSKMQGEQPAHGQTDRIDAFRTSGKELVPCLRASHPVSPSCLLHVLRRRSVASEERSVDGEASALKVLRDWSHLRR